MPVSVSRRRLVGGLGAAGLLGCSPLVGCRGSARPGSDGAGEDSGGGDDTGGLGATPAADGFRMPAETDPHVGTLMQFPPAEHYCDTGSSDCSLIERAWDEWAAVARAVAEFEPVAIYATPEDASRARTLCGDGVTVLEADLNDGWSRDSGPLFVRNNAGVIRATCFQFNGWGASYSAEKDARIKWRMASDLGVSTYDSPLVLEGGAVLVDGAGTLMATENCVLNANRNPDLSQAEIEQILKDYLGVTTIVWLENGWVPDDITDGHVDGIAAYVSPGLVLLNSVSEREDAVNYAILESARERLEAAGIEVIRLPATSFTAFHLNFYICNGGIIVPIEGRAAVDDEPLGIIRDTFPDYEVVGVVANTIGASGGGVHCITQQVPAGVAWPF